MKKYLPHVFSAVMLATFIACAPPSMIPKEVPVPVSTIKPVPGKSALVVSRTTKFGGAIPFKTYLDKTYIGATVGKSYFAKTDIDSGTRYVSSFGENGVAVKFNFEPDKVYFLQHNVTLGVLKARVILEAVNAKRLDSGELKDCTFYEFDPTKNEIKNLSEEEFKDVIQDADSFVLNADGTAELVPKKSK